MQIICLHYAIIMLKLYLHQRNWRDKVSDTKISMALVKAQKEFAPALKTATNPHFKSKYVGLDGCVEAVIDALNNNGIYLMQKTHECETGVKVETVLIHESGEQLSGGILHVPATKQDAQGYGSALTYARRYSLMASCGIAPEDDDGNAASNQKPVQQIPPSINNERLNAAIDKIIAGEYTLGKLKTSFTLTKEQLELVASKVGV